MLDQLKTHAAFDMQCTEAQLTTRETGSWTYGVRGCDRQAVYQMAMCNQLTQQCSFQRTGEISQLESPSGQASPAK